MMCFAPSEILDRFDASLFGSIAEGIIESDYLTHVGRFGSFPASPAEFFDSRGPFPSPVMYKAFLSARNPHVSPADLATLASGQTRVPDIMTHDDVNGIFEFYEIKPGSADGLNDGLEKIANIHALCQSFHLPYEPGTSYVPASEIEFFAGDSLGLNLKMFLKVRRAFDGLLLYQVCAEGGDFIPDFVLAAAVAAALIAMIALSRGRALRFAF